MQGWCSEEEVDTHNAGDVGWSQVVGYAISLVIPSF